MLRNLSPSSPALSSKMELLKSQRRRPLMQKTLYRFDLHPLTMVPNPLPRVNCPIPGRNSREVLQTEFRFRFRKGPRQISAGPGWSTPEKVETNFLFCKPNFLFRFGSINSKKGVVLATRCIVMSKNTAEKLNLCLLHDHYSWN